MLNVELNVDLTARYSGRIFSNAELNVDPVECRTERRSHRSMFYIFLNAVLNVESRAGYLKCLWC